MEDFTEECSLRGFPWEDENWRHHMPLFVSTGSMGWTMGYQLTKKIRFRQLCSYFSVLPRWISFFIGDSNSLWICFEGLDPQFIQTPHPKSMCRGSQNRHSQFHGGMAITAITHIISSCLSTYPIYLPYQIPIILRSHMFYPWQVILRVHFVLW